MSVHNNIMSVCKTIIRKGICELSDKQYREMRRWLDTQEQVMVEAACDGCLKADIVLRKLADVKLYCDLLRGSLD